MLIDDDRDQVCECPPATAGASSGWGEAGRYAYTGTGGEDGGEDWSVDNDDSTNKLFADERNVLAVEMAKSG